MGKEIITFGNTETQKQKINHYKNLIFKKYMDIGNLLISNFDISNIVNI